MGTEVRPLGVKCNISCQYCYQTPQRDAGNVRHRYNIEAMKEAIEAEGTDFTLFGGEPLLVPIQDLAELWRWGLEKYGRNGVQTNGTLISEEHIALFKEYKVNVGISVDGPGELNDARWSKSSTKTRQNTEQTHQAIRRLSAEGIPPSIIVTLHRLNASPAALPQMSEWFKELAILGVKRVRLHTLEVDTDLARENLILSPEENLRALLFFLHHESDFEPIRFVEFEDMKRLLLGSDKHTSCVWNACDPYTTRAVRGVEGDGQRSNCGRVNKEGIDFVKSQTAGFERYIALYLTPQENGGCATCRFFLVCKGQCPGEGIDGDWRNRSDNCLIYKGLFERLELDLLSEGKQPLSLRSDRGEIERDFIRAWSGGNNPTLESVLAGHLSLQR